MNEIQDLIIRIGAVFISLYTISILLTPKNKPKQIRLNKNIKKVITNKNFNFKSKNEENDFLENKLRESKGY